MYYCSLLNHLGADYHHLECSTQLYRCISSTIRCSMMWNNRPNLADVLSNSIRTDVMWFNVVWHDWGVWCDSVRVNIVFWWNCLMSYSVTYSKYMVYQNLPGWSQALGIATTRNSQRSNERAGSKISHLNMWCHTRGNSVTQCSSGIHGTAPHCTCINPVLQCCIPHYYCSAMSSDTWLVRCRLHYMRLYSLWGQPPPSPCIPRAQPAS